MCDTITDEPIQHCNEDGLGIARRCALPLARRIASKETRGSLTVGVYGPWGSGKSSLMNLVKGLVSGEDRLGDYSPEVPCLPVSFTAWKYDEEESLWRALVTHILNELLHKTGEHKREIRILRETLYGEHVETKRKLRVHWPRLAGGLVSLGSIALSSYLSVKNVPTPRD